MNSHGAETHGVPWVWGPRTFFSLCPLVRSMEPRGDKGPWQPQSKAESRGLLSCCQSFRHWTSSKQVPRIGPPHPTASLWPPAHLPRLAGCHPGAYLLSALVLAEVENSGFELQLSSGLLLLGDGHRQCGYPLLQLVDLPIPEWGSSKTLLTQCGPGHFTSLNLTFLLLSCGLRDHDCKVSSCPGVKGTEMQG